MPKQMCSPFADKLEILWDYLQVFNTVDNSSILAMMRDFESLRLKDQYFAIPKRMGDIFPSTFGVEWFAVCHNFIWRILTR